MTPDKIKQFWLTLATFQMNNEKDYQFFARLIVDSFNQANGEMPYKLALIMIKGMMQKAKPDMLDAFLSVTIDMVRPQDQPRFINQVTVASQLVLVIERCDGLLQELAHSSQVPPHKSGTSINGFRAAIAH